MGRNLIDRWAGLAARRRCHNRALRRAAFGHQLRRSMHIESLEARNLLAITPWGSVDGPEGSSVWTGASDAVEGGFSPRLVEDPVDPGTLTFNATEGASNFDLSLDAIGTTVQITQDGVLVAERAFATIRTLTINGNQLDNTLNVDLSNGNPVPVGGLFYNGGAESTELGDAIQIVGGHSFNTTYTPTVGNDGIITLAAPGAPSSASTPIYFTSLEPINDNIPATNLTIDGTAADNFIAYTNGQGGTFFMGDTGLAAVDAFETLEFNNKQTVILNGGAGNDEVVLNAPLQPAGLLALTVDGGDNDDVIDLFQANVPNIVIDGNVGMNAARIAGPVPGVFVADDILFDNTALEFEIGGTMPGDGRGFHDQLNVMRSVTLGNNVTLGINPFVNEMGTPFLPADGDQFVLINNDGLTPVTGQFNGLPEGALVSSDFLGSGLNAYLTYAGGIDNNDVVIFLDGLPTISGIETDQMIDDKATIAPFSNVVISDMSPALTVTVRLSGGDANGVLTDAGVFTKTEPGTYQLTAVNATAATQAIRALVFDPTENQVAPGQLVTTSFTIEIDDGLNPLVSDSRTTVMTDSINDAPIAADVSTSAVEDGPPVTVVLSAFDVDLGDDPTSLTYTIISPPGEGSITGQVSNTVTFDPGSEFQDLTVGQTRAVTFTYEATDLQTATSNLATGTITVVGVNDAPSFEIGNAPSVLEDAGAQTFAGFASSIDAGIGDDGQALNFDVVVTGLSGNLTFDVAPTLDPLTGTLNFRATDDTNGTATVEVTLLDDGGTSGPLAVDIPPDGGRSILDQDAFTVDDGVNPVTTFEFDTDSTSGTGNVAISITATSTADEIANQIVAALSDSGLALSPANLGGGRVLIDGSADKVVVDVSQSPSLSLFVGSGGEDRSPTRTFAIDVTAVNDAPLLAPTGTQMLTGTDEDTTSPSSQVAAIVAATISDIDAGALAGIAITATAGRGTWEFSTNGGANFAPFGAVSATQALLLRDTDLVRYVPDLTRGETPTITYRAWDQTGTTSGQQGFKVDASASGGAMPFSTALDTASMIVTDVNDGPVIDSLAQTGTLVESPDAAPGADTDPADAGGKVTFTDVDLVDPLTASVTAMGVTLTSLADGSMLTVNQESALLAGLALAPLTYDGATGEGTVAWTYDIANADIDFLGANDSVELSFTITVDDATATDAQDVTITINGANDAPQISGTETTAMLAETDTTLTATGQLTVTDVDASDTVTITVDQLAVDPASTFTGANPLTLAEMQAMLAVTPDSMLAADPVTGTDFSWVFTSGSSGDAAFDFLAAGETLILDYTLRAVDSSGQAVSDANLGTQAVVVTITGSNDRPAITVINGAGAVTEDDGDPLIDGGSVAVADADRADLLVPSVAKTQEMTDSSTAIPAALSSGLDSAVTLVPNGADNATLDWTFSLDNRLVQYLAAGETVTATYAITVTDDSNAANASTSQEITVVITGRNDQPAITDVAPNHVVALGTLVVVPNVVSFVDLDLADLHLVKIDWDFDGTTPAFDETLVGGIDFVAETAGAAPNTPNRFAPDAQHTYPSAGLFDVLVAVDDQDGGTIQQQLQVEVVEVVARGDTFMAGADAAMTDNVINNATPSGADTTTNQLRVLAVQDSAVSDGGQTTVFSDLGATIVMNSDGSFTYDPTTSGFLRALPDGVSVADTWVYQAGSTATITLGDPPTAQTAAVTVEVAAQTDIEIDLALNWDPVLGSGFDPDNDGGAADSIHLSHDAAGDLVIMINGRALPTSPLENAPIGSTSGGNIPLTRPIVVRGQDDDDTLTVDFTGGQFTAISFSGGGQRATGGSDGDALALIGTAEFDQGTFDYSNLHDGAINLDGQVITYVGLEPISSSLNIANVTLNYNDPADETITVANMGTDRTEVDSTAGERTSFHTPTSSLAIHGGPNDQATLVDLSTGGANLAVDVGITRLDGLVNSSSGSQNYAGPVVLTGVATLSGSSIDFGGTLEGANDALTIVGDATFTGTVKNVTDLEVTSRTHVSGGQVLTSGNQRFGGDVTLTGTTSFEAAGGTAFGGDIVTDTNANSPADLNIVSGGLALFEGQQMMLGAVSINALEIEFGAATGPKTLTSSSAVTLISNGRDLVMNTLQINAMGNIEITAATGIFLGQLATPGDVSLRTASGGIADGNTSGVDIVGARLTLDAESGIGSALVEGGTVTASDPLETSVEVLDATTGGIGIFIVNDGDLEIARAVIKDGSGAPYGIIDITTSSGDIRPTSTPANELPNGSEGEAGHWHNEINPLDVNNDGHVSPRDVLGVVNHINAVGGSALGEGEAAADEPGSFVDVNNDGFATSHDALRIINHLNLHGVARGEGEGEVSWEHPTRLPSQHDPGGDGASRGTEWFGLAWPHEFRSEQRAAVPVADRPAIRRAEILPTAIAATASGLRVPAELAGRDRVSSSSRPPRSTLAGGFEATSWNESTRDLECLLGVKVDEVFRDWQ